MSRPKRSGKTVAAGVTLVAAVGVAVLATIFMRGGGTGEGAGSGTGPADGTGTATGADPAAAPASLTQSPTREPSDDAPPSQPQRPLKVTVRESTYLVNGREVDLAQLGELAAKVPEGSGPAVMIERDPTSRAKAEQDLIQALDERKVPHASD